MSVLKTRVLRPASGFSLFAILSACSATPLPPVDLGAFEGAPAAVLDQRHTLSFRLIDGEPVAIETMRERSVIVSESGRDHAQFLAHYREAFSEVSVFDVKVTAPDGTQRTYSRKDANNYPSAPGFVLFSDARVLHIDATALTLGSQIETTVVTQEREPQLWTYRHIPAQTIPVLRSTFDVDVPEGWALEWRCSKTNIPCALPEGARESGGHLEHHTLNGLARPVGAPPLRDLTENYGVRLKTYVAPNGERVTPFSDVPALSRWKFELMEPQTHVTDAIRERARTILDGAPPDDRERAARLYAWVRDNISYCAIEVGLGGWRPHGSSQTFDVGYGDCKDKANLLRALLKADGINSHMVTIFSHRGYPHDFTLPTMGGNFNHAILEVTLPDGPVLADPTTRTVPFGELPFGDQGAHYMVADAQGRPLERSPLSLPEANPLLWTSTVRIAPDGQASADVSVETSGEGARRWRNALLNFPKTHWNKAIAEHFGLDESRVRVVAITADTPPLIATPLTISFAAERFTKAAAFDIEDATTTVLSGRSLISTQLPDIRDGHRDVPILLGYPRQIIAKQTLLLPEGWHLRGAPAPIRVQAPFGTLTAEFTRTPTGLVADVNMMVSQAVVGPEQASAVAEFAHQARVALNPQLLLHRK